MPTFTITVGSRVQFIKDGVMRTAAVFQITTDIENGRKVAIVELEHESPGNRETVPFDELKGAPLSQHIIFASGSVGYLTPEMNNRRFITLSIDSKRTS